MSGRHGSEFGRRSRRRLNAPRRPVFTISPRLVEHNAHIKPVVAPEASDDLALDVSATAGPHRRKEEQHRFCLTKRFGRKCADATVRQVAYVQSDQPTRIIRGGTATHGLDRHAYYRAAKPPAFRLA
jgi:hypothetical protein